MTCDYAQSGTLVGGVPPEKRLHESIGYVTPDDEHEGRGPAIRQARRDGLDRARVERIVYHRKHNPPEPGNAD